MTGAEGWLAAQGARKVQLMVRAGNPAATLYGHLGYERQDVEVHGRWLAGPCPDRPDIVGR